MLSGGESQLGSPELSHGGLRCWVLWRWRNDMSRNT
jgi:hypothetical protein